MKRASARVRRNDDDDDDDDVERRRRKYPSSSSDEPRRGCVDGESLYRVASLLRVHSSRAFVPPVTRSRQQRHPIPRVVATSSTVFHRIDDARTVRMNSFHRIARSPTRARRPSGARGTSFVGRRRRGRWVGWAVGSGVRVWGDGLFMWDVWKYLHIRIRYIIICVFGILLGNGMEARFSRGRRRDFGKERLTDESNDV